MLYKTLIFLGIFTTFLSASTKLENLKSFQGEFLQEITSTSGKKIEYKGEVFIKNTGKILWKYKEPIEKNVYILNEYVIIVEPELEQVIYTTLQDEINIIKLLNTSKEIAPNVYETLIDETKYLIYTKEENDELKIDFISYEDKLENKIKITFLNSLSNIQIDKSTFIFVRPKDYDEIRK